jgi:hypothetical protein
MIGRAMLMSLLLVPDAHGPLLRGSVPARHRFAKSAERAVAAPAQPHGGVQAASA